MKPANQYYVFKLVRTTTTYFAADIFGNPRHDLSGDQLISLVRTARECGYTLNVPDEDCAKRVRAAYIPSKGVEPVTLADIVAAEKSLSTK